MIILWRIRIWIENLLIRMQRKTEDRRTHPPVWERDE